MTNMAAYFGKMYMTESLFEEYKLRDPYNTASVAFY